MSKKTFWIIVICAIIAGIAIFFYISSSKTTPTATDTGNQAGDYSPFGKSNGIKVPSGTTPNSADVGTIPEGDSATQNTSSEIKLHQISTVPVSGAIAITKTRLASVETQKVSNVKTETYTAVRYMAKETGNIFDTGLDDFIERKISSTTIPKVYETFWGINGNIAIARYAKDILGPIQTFLGIIPEEVIGGDSQIDMKGSFWEENILAVSISNDQSKSFSLLRYNSGVVGIITDLKTKKKTQIFSSAFSEWLPQWAGSKDIFLTTKPSFNIPGFVYDLNIETGNISKIFGGITGLTTNTSPSGKFVLYANNQLNLRVFNVTTKEDRSLGFRTLPEKCTWSKNDVNLYCFIPKNSNVANFPDDWYQGNVSFSDELFGFDSKTGSGTIIASSTEFLGQNFDGINPFLDKDEHFLFFVSKKDGFLWSYKIN